MIYPKISIITPSYNQGHYLEETILSVLDQKYPNLEYIIIDGGSTDTSVEIIKKYQSKITYWISEKDEGQSSAINKGMQMATGDLVAWINSDDKYAENSFFEVAKIYSSVSITKQEQFWIVGDCQAFGTINWKFEAGEFSTKEIISFWDNVIGQPSVFWKRNLIQDPILNNNLFYSMDLDLWLRLSLISKPVAVKKTLSYARYYPETKTATGHYKRYEEIIRVLKTYNQTAKYYNEEYIEKKLNENFYANYFSATLKNSLAEFRLHSAQEWAPSFIQRFKIALNIIRQAIKYSLWK